MARPRFNLTFSAQPGQPVSVAKSVLRLTAPNPGPMTFTGTNTYIVGQKRLAIIDPGPNDESHFKSLMELTKGRTVSHVLTTHQHDDHAALALRVAEQTGAVWQQDFAAGMLVEDEDWRLEPLSTPGHTGDHLCYALADENVMFTGDHVMGWSTTVILPPDGKMGDYMKSLDLLIERPEQVYLPGHGGEIRGPIPFVKALRAHRKLRERAILHRLRGGDRTIREVVAALYKGTDVRLHEAAAMSVLAHLEDLVLRKLVLAGERTGLDANYCLA